MAQIWALGDSIISIVPLFHVQLAVGQFPVLTALDEFSCYFCCFVDQYYSLVVSLNYYFNSGDFLLALLKIPLCRKTV